MMSAIAGVFRPVLGFVGAVLGGATSLVIGIMFLFAIPLNVIADMRLFGWHFWPALISAVIISVIPLFGQLWTFAMVFVGAYFVVGANFNITEAVTSPSERVEVVRNADLTPQQFAELKAKLRPRLEAYCLNEGKSQFAVAGKLPSFVNDYCSCVATAAVAVMTKDDLDDIVGTPSAAFRDRVAERVAYGCRRS
jgi:hypothetical protein